MLERTIEFFKESYNELKKVSWLTKKEMLASTVLVIVLVIAMSIFVSFVDLILSRVMGLFIYR